MERIINEIFSLLERFFIKMDPQDKAELENLLKRILTKKTID